MKAAIRVRANRHQRRRQHHDLTSYTDLVGFIYIPHHCDSDFYAFSKHHVVETFYLMLPFNLPPRPTVVPDLSDEN